MTSHPTAAWWVRSFANQDTHRGIYSPVTKSVHALCGVKFQPTSIGWPPKPGPLPGYPPDPEQICPQCEGVTK